MIPEWKMMIIVGFWVNDKVLGSLFSSLNGTENFLLSSPIWKWTAASEAFHVFPILSHEFFNGFLMSKEGKRDTHKLNDFLPLPRRSFSSPTSSCLSGLILKIWLSIPKVLCCVFSQRRMWRERSWGCRRRWKRLKEWNLMKHDYGTSAAAS